MNERLLPPPDFLWRPVVLMNCMRLSEKKHFVRENQRSAFVRRVG